MGSTTRNNTTSSTVNSSNQTVAARETFQVLLELSKLLNTGLDAETLAICVRLCENGVNPEALALAINQVRHNSLPKSQSTTSGLSGNVGDTKR